MVVSFDCLCCYDTFDNVADDLLVECNAKIGHKLCKECFQSFVREELDGKNNPNLACACDTGCKSRYGERILERSLPSDLKERLDKASYHEMVAAFDDIWYVFILSVLISTSSMLRRLNPSLNDFVCSVRKGLAKVAIHRALLTEATPQHFAAFAMTWNIVLFAVSLHTQANLVKMCLR